MVLFPRSSALSLVKRLAGTFSNRSILYQALFALALQGQANSNAGIARTLIVAKNGDNGTAERGTFKPFLTISAAVAASLDGDVIEVGPGVYAENVVIPATRTGLVIKSLGGYQSAAIAPAAGVAVAWSPSVQADVTLEGLDLVGTTYGLDVDGAPAVSNESNLRVVNCRLDGATGAGRIQDLASATIVGGIYRGGALIVSNCNNGFFEECPIIDDLTLNVTVPLPANVSHVAYLLNAGTRVSGTLAQLGCCQVQAEKGVYAQSYAGTLSLSGAQVALIRFAGICPAWSSTSAAGNAPTMDLRGAQVNSLTHASASTQALTIDARGATLGALILSRSGGQNLIVDARGGSFAIAGSTFGAGTYVDRDGGATGDLVIANGGTALVFGTGGNDIPGPAFPPGTAVTYVAMPIVATTNVNQIPAITAKGAGGCTVANGSGGNLTHNIIYTRVPSLPDAASGAQRGPVGPLAGRAVEGLLAPLAAAVGEGEVNGALKGGGRGLDGLRGLHGVSHGGPRGAGGASGRWPPSPRGRPWRAGSAPRRTNRGRRCPPGGPDAPALAPPAGPGPANGWPRREPRRRPPRPPARGPASRRAPR